MSVKRMPLAVAAAVYERAGDDCEASIPTICTGAVEQLHHRKLRSQGGEHTEENLVGICAACHNWIHAHPKWAYAGDLLVHGWAEPVFPPRFYHGQMREEENNGEDQAGART